MKCAAEANSRCAASTFSAASASGGARVKGNINEPEE